MGLLVFLFLFEFEFPALEHNGCALEVPHSKFKKVMI